MSEDRMMDAELNRTLGRLTEAVKGLGRSLDEHKSDTKREFEKASESRDEVKRRLDVVEECNTMLRTYEPDLKRCRIIRHFGLVLGGAIVILAPALTMWESIVHLWQMMMHKG